MHGATPPTLPREAGPGYECHHQTLLKGGGFIVLEFGRTESTASKISVQYVTFWDLWEGAYYVPSFTKPN
jgi:hypothetical protein